MKIRATSAVKLQSDTSNATITFTKGTSLVEVFKTLSLFVYTEAEFEQISLLLNAQKDRMKGFN